MRIKERVNSMMVKEGEIITLDNNEEYAVMKKVIISNQECFILMTTKKPVEIKVCTTEEDEIILIEDKEIIKGALLQLI